MHSQIADDFNIDNANQITYFMIKYIIIDTNNINDVLCII